MGGPVNKILLPVCLALVLGAARVLAQEPPTGGAPKSAAQGAKDPIGANLAISSDMASMRGLDLKPDIKPNVKPIHRRPKGTGKDELCSGMNTMKTDMGRGIPTASPRECRGPVSVQGGFGFGGGKH